MYNIPVERTRKFIALLSAVVALFALCGCESAHEHAYVDGACSLCGEPCPHEIGEDLSCAICGGKIETVSERLDSKSENGNIFGIMFRPKTFSGKLKTVISCHGFGVNCSSVVPAYLAKHGYACYTFDFCGGSLVTRSDMAMEDMTVFTEKADLLAVFDTVRALPYVDENNIFLYGESQGGLVSAITSVELADKVAGQILMYPGFSMISEMGIRYGSSDAIPEKPTVLGKTLKRGYVEALFTYLPQTVRPPAEGDDVLAYRLELTKGLYEYIARYERATVLFHGTKDEMVDIAFSQEALKYYENARLYTIINGAHSFAGDDLLYVAYKIDRFIRTNTNK